MQFIYRFQWHLRIAQNTHFPYIADTMKVCKLPLPQPARANRLTTTTKNRNTVHPLSRMPFRTSTTRIQTKSTTRWANRTAICHGKCYWNRTVTVHAKCCSNKRVSAAFHVRIVMHRVSCCWNKTAVGHVAIWPNRIQQYRTLIHDVAIWCVRIRIYRNVIYCTSKTAAYRLLSHAKVCSASRTHKFPTLKAARRIRCAARIVWCHSANRPPTSDISWWNRIRWCHLPNHRREYPVNDEHIGNFCFFLSFTNLLSFTVDLLEYRRNQLVSQDSVISFADRRGYLMKQDSIIQFPSMNRTMDGHHVSILKKTDSQSSSPKKSIEFIE